MPGKYSEPARRGSDDSARLPLVAICALGAAAMALATVAVLGSCSRPPPKGAKPPVSAPAPRVPAVAAVAPSQAGKARPATPLAAPLRGYGLRAASVPRLARDYSLGPLQSARPAAGDEAAVFATVTAFMDGIAVGRLEKKLLLPQSRDALSALLAPPEPGAAPRNAIPFRLGAIALDGPDASLRLRLPAAAGAMREEGLLSLRKTDGSWYVEALALDPPAAGKPAFNPDTSAGDAGRAR